MSQPARKLALGAGIAVALVGIAVWPVSRASLDHLVIEPEVTRWDVAPPEAVQETQPVRPRPTQAPSTSAVVETDTSVAAEPREHRHPHPITPERDALQYELRLVGALQDALDLGDAPALRELIQRYRAHVPGDENKLAEGYERLADCLESSVSNHEVVRARALEYYENERASTVRRYIRRVCLER